MFWLATAFNARIGSWDTASVAAMWAMYTAAFNGNIGSWDTARVTGGFDRLVQCRTKLSFLMSFVFL
jgi:hypothetical protein